MNDKKFQKNTDINIEKILFKFDAIKINYDREKIKKILKSNFSKFNKLKLEQKNNIGLVCVSGKSLAGVIGILEKITNVFLKNKINIISINQPASENNILLFINGSKINKILKKLYQEFFQ